MDGIYGYIHIYIYVYISMYIYIYILGISTNIVMIIFANTTNMILDTNVILELLVLRILTS